MPDLNIEYFYHCLSAEQFETTVQGSKTYTVSYGPVRGGGVDYSCTCDAFKFRKKCKHIEQVKQSGKHCNWNQFVDGGDAENGCCPKCGGPVTSSAYGV